MSAGSNRLHKVIRRYLFALIDSLTALQVSAVHVARVGRCTSLLVWNCLLASLGKPFSLSHTQRTYLLLELVRARAVVHALVSQQSFGNISIPCEILFVEGRTLGDFDRLSI